MLLFGVFMYIFECEHMCYKFNLKEITPSKYNIYIYCDASDVELDQISKFANLEVKPGKFGPSLILNNLEASLRQATIHAHSLIDVVLLGSLPLK